MTKSELEKEHKKLKQKFRELQKTVKDTSEALDKLDEVAYGVTVIVEDGRKKLGLVKVNFDFDSGRAIVNKDSLFIGNRTDVNTQLRFKSVDELIKRDKTRNE